MNEKTRPTFGELARRTALLPDHVAKSILRTIGQLDPADSDDLRLTWIASVLSAEAINKASTPSPGD